jgi:hypothetical protein
MMASSRKSIFLQSRGQAAVLDLTRGAVPIELRHWCAALAYSARVLTSKICILRRRVIPTIIQTTDEIMAREKRDMLFIRFRLSFGKSAPPDLSWQRHLEWFASKNLRYELAAPRDWLEGDPGLFAVYFDGPDDPRIAQYSALFEGADGKSLAPEEYQMMIVPYSSWSAGRDNQEKDRLL